jgi:putative heme transporter
VAAPLAPLGPRPTPCRGRRHGKASAGGPAPSKASPNPPNADRTTGQTATTVAAPHPITAAVDVAPAPPRRRRRWVRPVVAVVAVGAVGWFATHELPPWAVLAEAFRRVDLPLLGVAALVEVLSLWLFTRQQQVLFAGFGVRVPVGSAVAITYSRSAMSMTFPAGSFVSAAFAVEQFRRFGASRSTAATVMVLSGIVSVLGLGGLYVVGTAAAWLFPESWQVVATVLGSLAAAYVLVRFALHRPLPSPKARKVRAVGVIRARLADVATLPVRYWTAGIGFAAANWAADLACLLITSTAFGVDLPLVQVGLVYLGIQLVRQVPISPGGIGVIETSLVAGLVLLGTGEATATAATLGYRMLSCWIIVPIGLAAWFTLSRRSAATA